MTDYSFFHWSAILSEVTEKLIGVTLGRLRQYGERVRKCALNISIQIPLRYDNRGNIFERTHETSTDQQTERSSYSSYYV